MDNKKTFVITPGIRNSRGHEIHGYAITEALKQYKDVEVLSLKKLDTSLIGRFFIWPMIEITKQIIASLSWLKFDELLRGKEKTKKQKYKTSLSTGLIGRGLVKFLKSRNDLGDIQIVSSHYAAIAAAQKAGVKNLTLIGPDFFPHPQTAIPGVFITSPGESFTKELMEYGIDQEFIKEIGTIVTPEAAENSKKYRELRLKVAKGEHNPMHILITMGGAGPEIKYVVQAVQKLKELILTGHQLCSISIVVGDDRGVRKRLRKKLLKMLNNQILIHEEGCGFRVFGGEHGFTKAREVKKTWELLASSEETNKIRPVDLVFTRPNDISLISTAMGIPTILFEAVGGHEVKARDYLTKEIKTSVLFEDWLKLRQGGDVINLGRNIEMLGTTEKFKFDSGEKLNLIVSQK